MFADDRGSNKIRPNQSSTTEMYLNEYIQYSFIQFGYSAKINDIFG